MYDASAQAAMFEGPFQTQMKNNSTKNNIGKQECVYEPSCKKEWKTLRKIKQGLMINPQVEIKVISSVKNDDTEQAFVISN